MTRPTAANVQRALFLVRCGVNVQGVRYLSSVPLEARAPQRCEPTGKRGTTRRVVGHDLGQSQIRCSAEGRAFLILLLFPFHRRMFPDRCLFSDVHSKGIRTGIVSV